VLEHGGPARGGVGRRALRFIAPWRSAFAGAGALLALHSLLLLVPAVLVKAFTDEISNADPDFGRIAVLAAVAGASAVLAALAGSVGAVVAARAAQEISERLRQQVFDRLLGQTIDFHTRARGGELISRITNDVTGIGIGLGSPTVEFLRGSLTAVAAMVVMVVISWQMALMSLAVLPVMVLGFRLISRAVYHARLAAQEQLGDLAAYASENLGLSGLMIVRSFGSAPRVRERFEDLSRELRDREIQVARASQWLAFAGDVLLVAGPVGLAVAGGYLVSQHDLSLASFLAFLAVAFGRFAPALHGLSGGLAVLIGSAALWTRVFAVLDHEPDIVERPGAVTIARPVGALHVDHVSFAYPQQRRLALDDVSFEVEPGRLVALVGPSGAGKTTAASLIARLIEPQAGTVRIDGHDVRDLSFGSLSNAVGLGFQDTFLFHASIRDNLVVGRPDASDGELWAAIADAQLRDLVESLPDGLDTVVGERGHRLSGGEKQRLAIARLILKDAPILVLDEATSHLDSHVEQQVQQALSRVLRGRTALVIAHRLSTVLAADSIVVLDEGRVVERGSHDELLQKGGLYARLYELQLRPVAGGVETQ
jgi:ATP-binding cassette, subfamily B, bacterial